MIRFFILGIAFVVALAMAQNYPATTITQYTGNINLTNGGKVGIGTDTPTEKLTVYSNNTVSNLLLTGAYNGTACCNVKFNRARGTLAAPTSLLNGDLVGAFSFWGRSTTAYWNCGAINLSCDGAVTQYVPTKLKFSTMDNNGSLNDNMIIKYNGFIGIGTVDPETRMDIRGTLTVQNAGGVPTDDIVIKRPGVISANNIRFVFSERETNKDLWLYGYDGATYKNFMSFNYPNKQISFFENKLRVDGAGDMRLDGKLTAKEIQVKTNVWADYVFKPGYDLKKLEEVESYIKKCGRLPGIPSEAEVSEKGVAVGAMQAKLLEKVEELTLYVIEQQKKLVQQEKEISELVKAARN